MNSLKFIAGLALTFFITAGAALAAPAPTAAAAAKSVEFTSDKGSIKFLAVGKPSAIKINGEGEAAKGTLTMTGGKVSGVLNFNLKSLKTGIDLRDKHMKEKYLQVDQYPDATLTLKDVAIPGGAIASGDSKDLAFTGKLKLKGVEKDVPCTAHIKSNGGNLDVAAQFSLKLDDFGVDIPKYLGITVANEVKVDVAATPTVKE